MGRSFVQDLSTHQAWDLSVAFVVAKYFARSYCAFMCVIFLIAIVIGEADWAHSILTDRSSCRFFPLHTSQTTSKYIHDHKVDAQKRMFTRATKSFGKSHVVPFFFLPPLMGLRKIRRIEFNPFSCDARGWKGPISMPLKRFSTIQTRYQNKVTHFQELQNRPKGDLCGIHAARISPPYSINDQKVAAQGWLPSSLLSSTSHYSRLHSEVLILWDLVVFRLRVASIQSSETFPLRLLTRRFQSYPASSSFLSIFIGLRQRLVTVLALSFHRVSQILIGVPVKWMFRRWQRLTPSHLIFDPSSRPLSSLRHFPLLRRRFLRLLLHFQLSLFHNYHRHKIANYPSSEHIVMPIPFYFPRPSSTLRHLLSSVRESFTMIPIRKVTDEGGVKDVKSLEWSKMTQITAKTFANLALDLKRSARSFSMGSLFIAIYIGIFGLDQLFAKDLRRLGARDDSLIHASLKRAYAEADCSSHPTGLYAPPSQGCDWSRKASSRWRRLRCMIHAACTARHRHRFLTSLFLHANLVHLAMNCNAIRTLSPTVEVLLGRSPAAFLALYIGAGLAGNLVSFATSQMHHLLRLSDSVPQFQQALPNIIGTRETLASIDALRGTLSNIVDSSQFRLLPIFSSIISLLRLSKVHLSSMPLFLSSHASLCRDIGSILKQSDCQDSSISGSQGRGNCFRHNDTFPPSPLSSRTIQPSSFLSPVAPSESLSCQPLSSIQNRKVPHDRFRQTLRMLPRRRLPSLRSVDHPSSSHSVHGCPMVLRPILTVRKPFGIISVGSSGCVFGLIGYLLACGMLSPVGMSSFIREIFIILLLGLLDRHTSIDTASHIGGLLFGILFATFFPRSPIQPKFIS